MNLVYRRKWKQRTTFRKLPFGGVFGAGLIPVPSIKTDRRHVLFLDGYYNYPVLDINGEAVVVPTGLHLELRPPPVELLV